MIFRIYPQSLVLNIEAPVFARNMEGGPGVPTTERSSRLCFSAFLGAHSVLVVRRLDRVRVLYDVGKKDTYRVMKV